MDSGASFSEPKISMEPLKAVQVRERERFCTVTPDYDRTFPALSAPLESTNVPFLSPRREHSGALSRKGRCKSAVEQRGEKKKKKNGRGSKERRRRSASFLPLPSPPLPSPARGSSFSSRKEQCYRSLHVELGEEKEQSRGKLVLFSPKGIG